MNVQEVLVVQEAQKVVEVLEVQEDLEILVVQEDPCLVLMKQQQGNLLALGAKMLFYQLTN